MDPKALDAGVGEVPSHPVDPNNPSMNGAHQNRNVLPENDLRSYPLVSDIAPATNRGITALLPPSPGAASFPHRGALAMPAAPIHRSGHIITDKRAG